MEEVEVEVGDKTRDMGTRMKEEKAVTNILTGEYELNVLDQDGEKTGEETNQGRSIRTLQRR